MYDTRVASGIEFKTWLEFKISVMSKWDSPYLNIWTEVLLRKVQGDEFHIGIVRGKREYR